MILKSLFTVVAVLLFPFFTIAQFSISGKIIDQNTGATLSGATISIENSYLSTVAGIDGGYLVKKLKPGKYIIKASYIGYQSIEKVISVNTDVLLDFKLNKSNQLTDEIIVRATRASVNSATTYKNLNKNDISKNNLGQDLPYLLNQTPSAVVTSDAGTGIGYTGIRIRGSDNTRINVTLNGVPLNDSEDQTTYFVDLPDLASSVDNIQVQRGVGTSTNGAGAFGASINIQTTTRRDTGYAEINNSAGSYGTVKNIVSLGSGLVGGKFSFDGRLSRIRSDGYVNRASSELKSYFLSGAYYGKNTLIRLNVFSGMEKTYLAYNGVSQDSLDRGNRQHNSLGLEPNGTFYPNETDNYTQNFIQLLISQKISDKISFNGALHYTKGFGYYEQYQSKQPFTNYGLSPIVIGGKSIDTTDLVNRLWLNNDFYGVTYALNYKSQKALNFTLGGAYNEYKGAHFGKIEWTQLGTNIPPDFEYSRDNAKKKDFNIFAKADYALGDITLFADLQYRHIDYSFYGFNENLINVQQAINYSFFNPKAGITYQINPNSNVYASIAIAHHEPNRDEFINSTPQSRPKAEQLTDFELGYRTNESAFTAGVNAFYMLYKDQLILTGQLNDVGAQIRNNVKDSYRAGMEFDGRVKLNKQLIWAATAAVSANKVKNFHQYLNQYDAGHINITKTDSIKYSNADIAFSPSLIISSEFAYTPLKGAEIALISKYVSRQYLDNTSTESRSIMPYFVNDVRLRYSFNTKAVKHIGISLLINNILSRKYESGGATYPEIDPASTHVSNYNYYSPQAPINFLAGLSLIF